MKDFTALVSLVAVLGVVVNAATIRSVEGSTLTERGYCCTFQVYSFVYNDCSDEDGQEFCSPDCHSGWNPNSSPACPPPNLDQVNGYSCGDDTSLPNYFEAQNVCGYGAINAYNNGNNQMTAYESGGNGDSIGYCNQATDYSPCDGSDHYQGIATCIINC